jgi:hypothetical protein
MPLKPISLADAEPLAAVFPTYWYSLRTKVRGIQVCIGCV